MSSNSNYRYPTFSSLLSAIADAIRNKEGTANLINAQDMPDRITGLGRDILDPLLEGNSISIKSATAQVMRNYALYGQQIIDIDLPGMNSIGYGALAYASFASGSYDLTLPHLEGTGSYAFQGCTGLRSVSLPEMLVLGEYAFDSCTSLERIYIGSPCINLNWGAFKGCSNSNLKIIIDATNPPVVQSNTFQGIASTAQIYVPDTAVETYKTATNWGTVASKILPMSDLPA